MINRNRMASIIGMSALMATAPMEEVSSTGPVEDMDTCAYSHARFKEICDKLKESGVCLTPRALARATGVTRTRLKKSYANPNSGLTPTEWAAIKQLAKDYFIEIGGDSLT